MAKAEQKTFAAPDETRTFENGRVDLVHLGDSEIGRLTLEPGWRWSEHVKPHRGYRELRGAAFPVPRGRDTENAHG